MEWVSDCYRAPSAITMSDNPLVESDENSGQCSFRAAWGAAGLVPFFTRWGSVDSKKNRMRPLAMPVSVARKTSDGLAIRAHSGAAIARP